jgi:hypothetical protein
MLVSSRPPLKQAALLFALTAAVASSGLPRIVSRHQQDMMASGVWQVEKVGCHRGATLMQGCHHIESQH